ncbi:MAG: YciK family oxidoreductase [Pseudomonadota bacterium]|nr:YciK family oxidoreductase [Pseudomonadota bacterium]
MNLRSYEPPKNLFKDRVILVTGATSGIGRAVSRDLIIHGATVILHGRDENALEMLFQEFRELGPEPVVAQLDFALTQENVYQKFAAELGSRFNKLDGLLHNAGILGDRTPIERYDIGLWQKVIQINLSAPFALTQQLLPLLRLSEDASVLFATSGVGNYGRAYWGAYCVSKFGIEGFAQILADELGDTRIRVNCINPGGTRTKMRHAAYPTEDPSTLPPPDTITGPYLYLLGPDSQGTTRKRIDIKSD